MLRYSTVVAALLVVACGSDGATPTVVVSSPVRAVTSESGGTAVITVVLTEQPTSSVSFSVRSDDTDEGVPDSSSIVFTPENWDTPQTITVTGVDDGDGENTDDGAQDFEIQFGEAVTDDARFVGLQPVPVELRNLDNEVNFEIFDVADESANLGWSINENGSALVLGVRLGDEPYEGVKLGLNLYMSGTALPPVSEANPGLGLPEDLNVSFNAADAATYYVEIDIDPESYDEAHEFTVVPIYDNGVDDPGKVFDLAIGASGDPAYVDHIEGLVIEQTIPYQIVNVDPDGADIIVTPQPFRLCAGSAATATVQLSQEPQTTNVQLALSTSVPDELRVLPESITLTAGRLSDTFTLELADGVSPRSSYLLTIDVTSDDGIFSVLNGNVLEFPVSVLDDGTTVLPDDFRGGQPAPKNGIEQQFCKNN